MLKLFFLKYISLIIAVTFSIIFFNSCKQKDKCYDCELFTENRISYTDYHKWVCNEDERKKLESQGYGCTEESQISSSAPITGPDNDIIHKDIIIIWQDSSDCNCGRKVKP